MKRYIVLDLGTTTVKAFVFDDRLRVVAQVKDVLCKRVARGGIVEQDPLEMIRKSCALLRKVVKESGLTKKDDVRFGLTNQRETVIMWDKKTGKPIHPAIVWQDTRTRLFCTKLKKKHEQTVSQKTGLSIDPYFSASKIRWLLKNKPRARVLLKQGRLAAGTVDAWLLFVLCKESPLVTDYTNASRTLLFNILTLKWDPELLELFDVPANILPTVKSSRSFFGTLDASVVGFEIPVFAVCGDQQASMYAVGHNVGVTKVTFGTGTFLMQIVGKTFHKYDGFFMTLTPNGQRPMYAVEEKIPRYGREIDAVLLDEKKLDRVLESFALDVKDALLNLPLPVKALVIDGGGTRDGKLLSVLERLCHVPVHMLPIYDGTPYGVAKLLARASKVSLSTVK